MTVARGRRALVGRRARAVAVRGGVRGWRRDGTRRSSGAIGQIIAGVDHRADELGTLAGADGAARARDLRRAGVARAAGRSG